jgi:hypothetical protein
MHGGAFGLTHKRVESNPFLTLNLIGNIQFKTNSIFFSKRFSDELKLILSNVNIKEEELKRNYESLFFENNLEEYNKQVNEAL